MKKLSFCIALFASIQLTPAQTNPASIKVETVRKHLYTLASDDMEGRRAGTPGIEKAAQYIESEFERIGLSKYNNLPTYRQKFTARNLEMFNIIGVLEGKSKKDEYVVVSAHYDHLGVIKNEANFSSDILDNFLKVIHELRAQTFWEKAPIVDLFNEMIPDFDHKETGKYLDGRM